MILLKLKLLFVFIFFLNMTSILCQDYHSLKNECEDLILNKDFSEAVICYEDLFLKYGSPFLKEVHNYFICSYYSENELEYATQLLGRFRLDDQYFKTFSKYLKDSIVYNSKVDNEASDNFFRRLNALDQSVRSTCKKLNVNFYEECGEEIRLLDSINLVSLIKYLDNNGFPNEYNSFSCLPGDCMPFYLTLIHNVQWENYLSDSIILKGISELKIDPEIWCKYKDQFASGTDKQYGTKYHTKLNVDELYIFKIQDIDLIEAINTKRKSVGASSLEKLHEKLKFQLVNDEFILVSPIIANVILEMDDQTKEILRLKWKDALVKKN